MVLVWTLVYGNYKLVDGAGMKSCLWYIYKLVDGAGMKSCLWYIYKLVDGAGMKSCLWYIYTSRWCWYEILSMVYIN